MRETSQLGRYQVPRYSLRSWRDGIDKEAAAAELLNMRHGLGFFYVIDHDISQDFQTRYFSLLEKFFALPEATKALIDKRKSPHFRGWERVGAELTNNRVDYREQLDLDVSTENAPYSPHILPHYLRLDGPNQWLPDEILPGFHDTVLEFFDRLGALAWELQEILAVGLGLDPNYFRERFGERPLSFVKLISYPPSPPRECGVNAHKDAGFLSFLLQRGVGVLQALAPDEKWVDVSPPPGAIIVNIGEILQALTSNYFVACTHRVITSEPRLSAAYFHGPDLRTPLTPILLPQRFLDAVAKSPRHAGAGFMEKRDELLEGKGGIRSAGSAVYGEQLWNYYMRSYPENVEEHYPGTLLTET